MTPRRDAAAAALARLRLLEQQRGARHRCDEAKRLMVELCDVHGLSAAEVARGVGMGLTRCAVIGQVSRSRGQYGPGGRQKPKAPEAPEAREWTDEESLLVLRMRDARRSAGQMARALPGRTPEEVSVHLRDILRELAESEGEEVRLPVKHPENLGAELLARYEQGTSASALAAERGLGLWAVHGLLRRARDARGSAP